MTFYTFIKNMPKQESVEINDFIEYALNDPYFPQSNDPNILAIDLCDKLNESQTKGFQKSLMFYYEFEPKNEVPKAYKEDRNKFLKSVNTILYLQENEL